MCKQYQYSDSSAFPSYLTHLQLFSHLCFYLTQRNIKIRITSDGVFLDLRAGIDLV